MTRKQRYNKPGRPSGQAPVDVRRKLIEAARDMLIESGYDGASTKQIAARAGVNAAMINYYFDSKEGLSRAMMLDVMSPLISRLEAVAAQANRISLAEFLRGYMQTIAVNQWLPQLVVREVLPVNGRLRAVFLQELTARAAKLLPDILAREQQEGTLRREIDPDLLLLSMMSLAVFPFVARPVIEPTLGIKLNDPHLINRLIEHTLDMLHNGAGMEQTG
jgi:AcrR family transcriptional regulator